MIPITSAFLAALITVESGGDWTAIGDNGKARGGLQIHEQTWYEGVDFISTTRVGWDWGFGSKSETLSKAVARGYLEHWGEHYEKVTGKPVTEEVLARLWNGGPNGWKKRSTIKYWVKVNKVLKGKFQP